MKLIHSFFFSFTIFLFVFIVSSKLSPALAVSNDYNNGYNNGFNNGYNNNYNNGYNNGFNNNYNNGYNNYFNNYNNGYNNGFNNGYVAPKDPSPDTKADLYIQYGSLSVWECGSLSALGCSAQTSSQIWNAGPDKAEGISVTRQLYVNGVKWPFQSIYLVSGHSNSWSPVGFQSGGIVSIKFEKPPAGSTMVHVLTVNSQNDPDFSNNVFTEIVTIP
jgi:hypothetical protein